MSLLIAFFMPFSLRRAPRSLPRFVSSQTSIVTVCEDTDSGKDKIQWEVDKGSREVFFIAMGFKPIAICIYLV